MPQTIRTACKLTGSSCHFLLAWSTATWDGEWWPPPWLQCINRLYEFWKSPPTIYTPTHATACRLHYVLGEAKSQAVSWAHFHMARTSRVKPMSLGFSSPRISRCFMMAMNSLLLSSPFPGGDGGGKGGEGEWRTNRERERWWNNKGKRSKRWKLLQVCPEWFPARRRGSLPSQSNRANTTSHTWSDSSTLATVRATCFMVTGDGECRGVSVTKRTQTVQCVHESNSVGSRRVSVHQLSWEEDWVCPRSGAAAYLDCDPRRPHPSQSMWAT